MNIVKIIVMIIAGIFGGWMVPYLSKQLIAYKEKQKNKTYPVKPGYTSIICKTGCTLVSAIGLGACGYFDASWIYLILTFMIWLIGMVVILVDLQIRIIANETVLALLILSVVVRIVDAGIMGLVNSMITMIATMAVWLIVGKYTGLWMVGAGDVKLCGVMGFLFGFPNIKMPLMIMALALLVYCLGGLALRKLTLRSAFAMGPFIAAGILLGLPYVFYLMSGGYALI